MNVVGKANSLRYLFYTTNQLADHFGSLCTDETPTYGPRWHPGNNIYNTSDGNDSYSEFVQLKSTMGPPITNQNDFFPNNAGNLNTTNTTYVYSIRAIAGLLHWFAVEAGLINNIVVKNSFEGGQVNVQPPGLLGTSSYPSGVSFMGLLNEPFTVAVTSVNQTFGGYVQHFNQWQKIATNGSVAGTYSLPSWSTTVTGNHTYKAKFNKEFNITLATGRSVEGVDGGTYRVNYGNPVSTWSGTFTENVSAPIHVEAIAPNNNWFFINWSDGSSQNPRDFVPGDHSNIRAIFKQRLASSSQIATATNNQRKICYLNGKHHMIYESGGEIWYTTSVDGGTWGAEFRISDGGGNNRHASLAINKNANFTGTLLGVVWESNGGQILIRRLEASNMTWSTQEVINPENLVYDTTPNLTIEQNIETVVWKRQSDFDPYNNGLNIWVNDLAGNTSFTTLIPGTNSYSQHPSTAEYPYMNAPNGIIGLAWSQQGWICYQTLTYDFNEQGMNFGDIEWISPLDGYALNDFPSLTFDMSSSYRPVVAWQAFEFDYSTRYVILQRRKETTGWGTFTQFVPKEDDYLNPSITRAPSGSNLYMTWQNESQNIFISRFINNWWSGSSAISQQGSNPTLGYDNTFESKLRILYASGSSSPYTIATTNSGVYGDAGTDDPTGGSVTNGSLRTKSLDIRIGEVLHTVRVKKLTLNGQGNTRRLALTRFADSLAIRSESDAREFLSLDSVRIPLNTTLNIELRVKSRLVDSAAAGSNGKLQLSLQAFDANTGALLATIHMDTLTNTRRNGRNKTVTLNLAPFAGRDIRFTVQSKILSGSNIRWTSFVIYEDSTSNGNGSFNAGDFVETQLPSTYTLHPNFPNPFNPSTTLNYDLPEPANVSLVVYDVLGRKVIELVNGTKEAGYHSTNWNAKDVASGVYFTRFMATDVGGNVKLSKINKLVLMK